MTYEDAVFNALQGKCVPYRKETKAKLNELLKIAEKQDKEVQIMTHRDTAYQAFYSLQFMGEKQKAMFDDLLKVAEELDRKESGKSMSKFNVGDKFEIEIAEVFKGAESGNDKYRIKGFDNLVFDDKGLEKIRDSASKAKTEYNVGDIVYIPEDERCAVILWVSDTLANVLYSDYMLGINMSLDRLSGVYAKSQGLKLLADEIEEETQSIELEAQEFAETVEELGND